MFWLHHAACRISVPRVCACVCSVASDSVTVDCVYVCVQSCLTLWPPWTACMCVFSRVWLFDPRGLRVCVCSVVSDSLWPPWTACMCVFSRVWLCDPRGLRVCVCSVVSDSVTPVDCWPGIKTGEPAVKVLSTDHCITREFPDLFFLYKNLFL